MRRVLCSGCDEAFWASSTWIGHRPRAIALCGCGEVLYAVEPIP